MTELTDELLADAGERMTKSVEATRNEFSSVRTGRASPGLLDRIVVDYYGAQTPLKQLATISAPEARLLTVQPYDQASIKSIEKAIMESDLGLTPSNDGNVVRLQIPELNEERRREMVKIVHGVGEQLIGQLSHVATRVPTRSPDTIRSMLRSSSMLKTWIGRPFSMHSVRAVRSMIRRRRSSASMWVISAMNSAAGSSRGSAV